MFCTRDSGIELTRGGRAWTGTQLARHASHYWKSRAHSRHFHAAEKRKYKACEVSVPAEKGKEEKWRYYGHRGRTGKCLKIIDPFIERPNETRHKPVRKMAPTELEVTIMGADDLKNVSTFGGKMDLMAVVFVDSALKRSTRVLYKAGRNPVWNDTVTLPLGHLVQQNPSSYLTVQILCVSSFGDKEVGTTWISLQEIYRVCANSQEEPALVTMDLQRRSGRVQGVVRLSMTLKDNGIQSSPVSQYGSNSNPVDKNQQIVEGIPVMGIPMAGPYSVAPNDYGYRGDVTTATGYPSLTADSSTSSSSSGTSSVIPYAYPPAYGSYPHGYTYPAPYPQQVYQQVPYSYVQPPQPQRSSGGGLLLGLFGGALGGLILGDILM
ncbi:hypothetical protein R1flu_019416 [Riccia fluitans]|uniref:C2 domain-containing protein n=1 Tax=Riccia fluitans TaxID=41844 RepID=A0ABD1ZIS5_9MARC